MDMDTSDLENVRDNLKLALPRAVQPPRDGPFKEQSPFSSLSKQSSILSLTLDEIQYKSGRSFGSMNMDEFLANIWSVEENQSLPCQSEHGSNKSTVALSSLARQGSFSIPTPLCNKTVDEVWYEIHKDQQRSPVGHSKSYANNYEQQPRRQHTLGEMTLEDFLVKAGVVQASPTPKLTPPTVPRQQANFVERVPSLDSGFGIRSTPNSYGYSNPLHNGGSNLPGNGYPGYPTYAHNNRYIGECTSGLVNERCQSLAEVVGLKHRRIIDGPPEVVVERRQRRMIKNRESAARSRARKQAYTVELEVELNQLKDENEKLKSALEEAEQKRKMEMMLKRKQTTKAEKVAEKFRAIRRTLSNGW